MCNTNQQGLNEMTENETNQRTITEQMNRKESETVGETRPGGERSEVNTTALIDSAAASAWVPCSTRAHQTVRS